MPIPDEIRNAPEPLIGTELFHSAFNDLTSSRTWYEHGAGPIKWGDIKTWADEHRLSGEVRSDLFHLIPRMDAAYIKLVNKKGNGK